MNRSRKWEVRCQNDRCRRAPGDCYLCEYPLHSFLTRLLPTWFFSLLFSVVSSNIHRHIFGWGRIPVVPSSICRPTSKHTETARLRLEAPPHSSVQRGESLFSLSAWFLAVSASCCMADSLLCPLFTGYCERSTFNPCSLRQCL